MNIEKISRKDLFKIEKDYIFHGSTHLFEKAKPHQANCATHNKENEHLAIYGTNDLRFAILFAFDKQPKKQCSWRATNNSGIFVGELENGTYINEDAKGYLYCFDKTRFKPTSKDSAQFICKDNLLPQKIFEISYKDYKDLFIATKTNEQTL